MTNELAFEILIAAKKLNEKDVAEIKKNFGKKYSQIPIKTYMAYKKVVSNLVPEKENEIVFPVVAMFVFCGRNHEAKTLFPYAARAVTGDNEKEFLRIAEDFPSDGTHMLYRIANICYRAKQKGININFARLMTDLCRWNNDENEEIKRTWISQYVENKKL